MSKQLFNRNDPASIKAAFEMTKEEFVEHFTESTSSSADVLSDLYDTIRKNNKAAIIQRNSGATKNNEPIETIEPIKAKTEMAKKKNESIAEAPKMRTEFLNGETVRVPMEQVEKMEPLEEANAKAVAKANKPAKGKVVKEKAPKAEKPAGEPTKQDKIKELILGGATNKEIKLLLAEEGLKVYDSEILNAKNKLPKATE